MQAHVLDLVRCLDHWDHVRGHAVVHVDRTVHRLRVVVETVLGAKGRVTAVGRPSLLVVGHVGLVILRLENRSMS